MIAHLHGIIIEKQAPHVVIDVNGVGYDVETPMSSFFGLPENGQKVTLRTHLVVREDAHILYGFSTENERILFRQLIKVNGIGPKVALGILSGMNAQDFTQCVLDNNVSALVSLPGIGKKTAERLIIEMRDRLGSVIEGSGAVSPSAAEPAVSPVNEAISALVALGYKQAEAEKRVRAVNQDGLDSEALIRSALQSKTKK